MLEGLEIGGEGAVVEFGPGTGPFTEVIADRIGDPERYLGIECDSRLVQRLRRRFPDLKFIEGSAEHACLYHQQEALPRTAAVISGLPFASLPATVQDGVIEAIRTLLAAGGVFRTFQYAHAYGLPAAIRFRARMNQLFGPCTLRGPVFRNVPPACVLTWRCPALAGTSLA